MAEQASSAFGNASSISTRLVENNFNNWNHYLKSIYYWEFNLDIDYRRGNIEGNTRSRIGFRKDSKTNTNNQEEDTVSNSNNTELLWVLKFF